MNAIFGPPPPWNEPVLGHAPGSADRRALEAQLDRMTADVVEITPRIGGERVATGRTAPAVMPHDHGHVLAAWHRSGPDEVARAIETALIYLEYRPLEGFVVAVSPFNFTSIAETFVPPTDFPYPFTQEERR